MRGQLRPCLSCRAIFFTAFKVSPLHLPGCSCVISPRISSAFHKEVSSCTASAQGGKTILLRRETFRRKVGSANTRQSQSLPMMIAVTPVADWQFSRVNCQGNSETRASAYRLPGHCGLLHSRLSERTGQLATRRGCREVILGITLLHSVLVKAALPVSAVGPVPSSRCS